MSGVSDSAQYTYGLDVSGALTHIKNAERGAPYTCPGCKAELTPVLGKLKIRHYRHFKGNCSSETYLHKCAKKAIYHRYNQAVKGEAPPVTLKLERLIRCHSVKSEFTGGCEMSVPAHYNLNALFNGAYLEKKDALTGLIPDVMLVNSNSNHRVYIEIYVTHPCSPEKIDAGNPIMEFYIQTESDIDALLGGTYSVDDKNLTLYNFNVAPRTIDTCEDSCPLNNNILSSWSLSENGRLYERIIRLKEVRDCGSAYSAQNTWSKSLPNNNVKEKLVELLKHSDPNQLHLNCLLCRNSRGWNSGYLYCSEKIRDVPYTEAQQCIKYEVSK